MASAKGLVGREAELALAAAAVRRLAADSGYRVIEVWESREAHHTWYDDHIAPNLPPGTGPIAPEYIDLLLAVPES